MKISIVVAIALAAGCKGGAGGDAPRLNAALMPPGTEGLVLGKSTEAEVKAKLPGASIKKDQSLGGEGIVQFDDHPIETISTGAITFTLWADDGGTLRLQRIGLFGPGHCAWLKQAMAKVEGAERCRGTNRRSGDHGHEMFYCLATEDGAQRVWVNCSRDTPKVGGGTADELSLSAS